MADDAGKPRHPLLPQLRFDELIDELVGRLDQVKAARGRVQQLLQGVLAVSGGLDLDQVLRTIIETATELVEAQYGALGVIGGEAARPPGALRHRRPDAGADRRDRPLPDRHGHPRAADPASGAAAPGGHRRARGVRRVPRQPPADADVPGRADPGPRRRLRQPLPDREARRRPVRRRRRGAADRARRGGRGRHRQRPPLRRGAPAAALDGGRRRADPRPAVRRGPGRRAHRAHRACRHDGRRRPGGGRTARRGAQAPHRPSRARPRCRTARKDSPSRSRPPRSARCTRKGGALADRAGLVAVPGVDGRRPGFGLHRAAGCPGAARAACWSRPSASARCPSTP